MSAVRQIYRGRIVDLRIEEVTLPNGAAVALEIIRHPGAAAVVALDGDGVRLIRQYRHAAGGFIWEIPAGTLHPGEPPLDCAHRELREETGCSADDMVALGSVLTAPGFCDECIHLFLARGLHAGAPQLDADEVLSVSTVALPQALAMIRTGAIRDAKSIAGLYRAAAFLGTDEVRP